MATGDTKKSPQLNKIKLKVGNSIVTASDSDASVETNSLSADSATEQNQVHQNEKRRKKNRRGSEWEIMEGLKDGQRFENKPNLFNGYLHKKRKWPLKGWHKRYFTLDKGILVYGKGPTEINKGKIHGSLDIGLSVITTKQRRRRIDIDAEEFIYHLKAKTDDTFSGWVQQLTAHRLYRQHILTYGTNVGALFSPTDGLHNISRTPEIVSRDGSLTRGLKPPNGTGRLSIWLQESLSTLEQYQRDATVIEQNITKLSRLLQQIESSNIVIAESACEALSPNVKKDRRKFGLKKKKSSKGGSVDLTIQFANKSSSATDTDNISPLSANSFSAISSSPQLNAINASTLPIPINATCTTPTPDSLSNVDVISLTVENQMRDDFLAMAKTVLSSLKTLTFGLSTERERLKSALESEVQVPPNVSNRNVVNLKNNLNQVLQQNTDLRSRLLRIHEASDLADLSSLEHLSENQRVHNVSLSYSSSCVSATEFFDAEDLPVDKPPDYNERAEEESEVRTRSESSSEAGSLSSGEGSISSESELGAELNPVNSLEVGDSQGLTGRRTVLPVPRPITEGLSLWNLLSRNIGKDLSQISMPVALNEPLNVLQRLCEELEYSDLLDKAASIDDPYERMVEIAAFAVSAYASTLSRAGNKPFNPLLGETYECIREDKGFRFLAEQVSHHPPVGACYAESSNFTFWQEARVKTKFWGKSMEFQPLGSIHVLLPKTGDLYTWNKVTTCVHNLFSGQRWVDQYGELKISNGRITCKLTFSKASYWSAKRHEVVGAVFDESGKPVRRLFGKWSESLYCGVAPSARCIWRAGTLPPNHERYYGFTRFAVELNELDPDSYLLPPTDTRLRPDQRALEEGDLTTAENLKLQLEMAQRERRKRREELGLTYEPRWFSSPQDDVWEYNGKYWDMRRNPGFSNMQFESLW
ncbi:oxysterol-binding protein-related protein 3 isoform X1 [Anoplophora glabripennis]|uniref:oxysterol-binding protein-related protein 3 isoform X1 n=1 Tax=Anoplophora glabripennis TaxID=217634 RepID=UPI000873AABF|nr:oxysterol-binding protein-related protein 3 isoform X1 [Anoplophora glabripennis]XP_018566853.1 oxysterol-binding protein-related protein 3 isoform X1 [Anoplophora glabripennis]